jgi:serine/threonine-protein kinase
LLDRLDRFRRALADRYVIENQIGAGGMGTVFLAEDLKHDRHVAIKVLHPELASHGYHPERFLREIKTVAGLTHPNILPLHDSGERGGFLFFVMPFVEGESLRRRLIRDRQLGIDEAIRITRTVAGALDYAHKNDVLHRDIKPENILFQEGQPLVADFGVSRAISECCDDLGEAGAVVGTPEYVSPEQASAEDELDGRSDVYSLACVLYEMLAGGPPFGGSDVREILARQVAEAAPPVRSARAEVPGAVGRVLGKALEKDPAERYATAADFRDALGEALSQPEHPAFAPARRDATIIAVLPFVNASSDPDSEYLSDGITDELINALTKVDGLQVVSRTSVFALKGESRDVRSIGALLGASAVLEGTVRKAGTRLRIAVQLADVADGRSLWSERYDRDMQDVFAIEDEIAQTIVNTLRSTILQDIGDPTSRRYTANVTAYNLYLKGRYHWNTPRHIQVWPIVTRCKLITAAYRQFRAWSGQSWRRAGRWNSTTPWLRHTHRWPG